MIKPSVALLILSLLFSCQPPATHSLNPQTMASLGGKFKTEFQVAASGFEAAIAEDPSNTEALLGLAETHIILYIFGFTSREETLPASHAAYQQLRAIDSVSSPVLTLSGKLHMLDWQWNDSQTAFLRAIAADPNNLDARHWYSLWLIAMDRIDEAMAQSDTISSLDTNKDHLIGRASLLYFQYRFEEMKPLMQETIARDPAIPWGYDWLGMAYNGLGEHEDAISTYFKAFELSDGTVEVGGGLGHALGMAGETELAKEMADYYTEAARDRYLPPVQRAFVHLGIGEHEAALQLLEQAYQEQSWFLIFMQVEHWYDPIRSDPRFADITNRMQFPE